jgi:putative ATP-dependent endonuclease of OLD family
LALALIFRHDYVSVQSRNLQLEDFNYSVVQNFCTQVADANVKWSDIEFPSIEVRASLTDFTPEQQAVVGDWFSNQDCKEASLTYSYRLRPSFNSEKWILEQRARHEQHANAALIQLPVDDYRATITGGRGAVECDGYLVKTLRLEVLDALRDAKRELTAGEGRVLYRVLKQASSGSYLELEKYLASLQETVAQNASLHSFKSEIGAVLEKVSLVEQSADNSVDFRFFSPNTDDLLAKIGLIYGADPIAVERNGLGRNNLLFLGLLISQLCKPGENPGDTENYVGFRIMGVEEPEAHLHPHLQEHLASNLEQLRQGQDKQLQLLLTSHSTHISSKMDLENTVVVYRDRASGQLRSHYVLQGLDGAKGLKIKRFLSLYLDATKSKMLFARLVCGYRFPQSRGGGN